MLCFFFRFSIYCIAFCKRGGDFPLFIKSNTLSFSLAIHSPGKLLFARWVYCSFFSFSSPRDRQKNLRSEKGIFFFCSEFFSYRANARNQKDVATEKEEKHKPGKLPLSCLPGVCDYLFYTGRRLNHEGFTNRFANRGGARERGKSDKLTFMLVEWRWIDRSFSFPLMLPP